MKGISAAVPAGGRTGAVLAAAALILVGAVSASCSPADEGPTLSEGGVPRIVFEQEDVHFGEAAPADRVEYEFSFRNAGDAPLVISDISAKTLEGC